MGVHVGISLLALRLLSRQQAFDIVKCIAQAGEGLDGSDGLASPAQCFQVQVVTCAVQHVLCKGDIAALGWGEAVAPCQPVAAPRCKVRGVVLEAGPDLTQPGRVAFDAQLNWEFVAQVAQGIFLEQEDVHEATVACLSAAAQTLHGEVAAGSVGFQVEHHVADVVEDPHRVLFRIAAL